VANLDVGHVTASVTLPRRATRLVSDVRLPTHAAFYEVPDAAPERNERHSGEGEWETPACRAPDQNSQAYTRPENGETDRRPH
jgi:hypothetical protein